MNGKGPYARVYQSIVDDPMFARVFDNDKALATWLRMLLVADAMHPVSAPMPRRNPSVSLLIDVGLVQEVERNRYLMRGLEAERERRSHAGRIAAASRWGMPNKAKQSRTEQSKVNGNADASPQTFMGWKPKAGYHDGSHPDCAVCAPLQAAPSSQKEGSA